VTQVTAKCITQPAAADSFAGVRYDEITQKIITSSPGDWERLERLGGPAWPSGHPYLAVYKPDAGLRLAWGLMMRDDVEVDGWKFIAETIEEHLADAFWHGALVARWSVLAVDNVHGYLPRPSRATAEAGDPGAGAEHLGWTVTKSETAVPRLLHGLTPECSSRSFDSYLKQTGTVVTEG
jgi:hypothetical protein